LWQNNYILVKNKKALLWHKATQFWVDNSHFMAGIYKLCHIKTNIAVKNGLTI